MGKSLRSKWKRQMRAEKRIRYGEKERAKLLKMVETYAQETQKDKEDEKVKELPNPDVIPLAVTTDEKMEMSSEKDGEGKKKGTYPVWMSQRRVKKIKELAKHRKNPELKFNTNAKSKKAQRRKSLKRK